MNVRLLDALNGQDDKVVPEVYTVVVYVSRYPSSHSTEIAIRVVRAACTWHQKHSFVQFSFGGSNEVTRVKTLIILGIKTRLVLIPTRTVSVSSFPLVSKRWTHFQVYQMRLQ